MTLTTMKKPQKKNIQGDIIDSSTDNDIIIRETPPTSNFSALVEKKMLNDKSVKVLDVGCGPGTWLLEMSSEFPKYDTFDFVHMRFLCIAFTEDEWEHKVIPELTRLVKPGGYIEIMEADLQFKHLGNNGRIFLNAWLQDLNSRFINPLIIHKLEGYLHATPALHNIVLEHRPNPVGDWGGRIGKVAADIFVSLIRSLETRIIDRMGLTSAEFQELIEFAAHEFNEQNTYAESYRIYARKICDDDGIEAGSSTLTSPTAMMSSVDAETRHSKELPQKYYTFY
ncbi:5005_t:CDS:2 [Ambispora leptoticha]|uniref:5005_t:CDS:1 n=1 Tax=Ambispora leptoticha TaxID=144679 RepID=A0A9N9BMP2_9GLOM|nr:5005_t:CDS:2 [Ambispora leptoticha]